MIRQLALSLSLIGLVGCSPVQWVNNTGRPMEPGSTSTEVEPGKTFHYKVIIYPGTEENFNPSPKLTIQESNILAQFDGYCAAIAQETLAGMPKELFRQGATYGVIQGILTAVGAKLAFGPAINVREYLEYAGLASFGGGIANGVNTYQLMENVVQGYCMTGMVYKANELEGKLRRLWIVPMYVGSAELPEVDADLVEPVYNRAITREPLPPPPPR